MKISFTGPAMRFMDRGAGYGEASYHIVKSFKDLGMEDGVWIGDLQFSKLEHYLGKSWWNSEKLEITLGASISNKFKRAYIKMGISKD